MTEYQLYTPIEREWRRAYHNDHYWHAIEELVDLRELAPYDPVSALQRVLDWSHKLRGIDYEYYVTEAIMTLVETLEHVSPDMQQAAVDAAWALQDTHKRSLVLEIMSWYLPRSLRVQIIRDAFASAQHTIEDRDRRERMLSLASFLIWQDAQATK